MTQNARLSTSCQKVVILDHFWVVGVVTVMVPFLTNLRANADSFDNFLDNNHKAVLLTMVLTTR